MIELHKLTKAFGSKVALRGVDLRVAAGESLVIFGPNGAGKSTLIRILSSLSRPSGGMVRIGGYDLATHAEGIRRYLGVVSHAPLLYDSLTAEENLRFFGRLYGVANLEARIGDMLSQVGLTHRRGDLVRTFSRGMVQRLAIARALLHDPQLLLLDEPDTGLDPQAAEMLHGLLTRLSKGVREQGSMGAGARGRGGAEEQGSMGAGERGSGGAGGEAGQARPHAHTPTPPLTKRTIVTVTHSIERGLAIADRVIILADGRIVFDADARGMTAAEFRPLYDRHVA
jgi:heme exporter protein A